MKIRIAEDGNENDINEIHELLREYGRNHREKAEYKPLGLFIEDEKGNKLAGLTGQTFGNWLCIRYLYVAEQLRGQGIGTQLISKAEALAKERGCHSVFVDTFSFQAPQFYEKLGYKEVFVLKGYPYTESRHYYTKEI